MRFPNLLPLLALLPLQACITTVDTLSSSRSSLTLPLGAVHAPPRDSGILLQGSLAMSGAPKTVNAVKMERKRDLIDLNSQDARSEVSGASLVVSDPVQVAAQGSVFLSEHLRVGGGIDVSSKGMARWGELGVRFGKQVSVETFAAYGTVPVSSTAHWRVTTTDVEESMAGTPIDTVVTEEGREISGRERQDFLRYGVHVARREGGPFAEVQILSVSLLQPSPTAYDRWGTTLTLVGAGWSQPTAFGTGTAYVRALYTGKTVIPSLGVQWTGEIKLGR